MANQYTKRGFKWVGGTSLQFWLPNRDISYDEISALIPDYEDRKSVIEQSPKLWDWADATDDETADDEEGGVGANDGTN